jgi:hypothetical protein
VPVAIGEGAAQTRQAYRIGVPACPAQQFPVSAAHQQRQRMLNRQRIFQPHVPQEAEGGGGYGLPIQQSADRAGHPGQPLHPFSR